MRLTEFRSLMACQFGSAYADTVARDYVFRVLGGRTVDQAIEAGVDPKVVWRAVCEEFDVPPSQR
ncbi:MAG: DUF3046 domain-containing protein [Mycobacteriales bacterium]